MARSRTLSISRQFLARRRSPNRCPEPWILLPPKPRQPRPRAPSRAPRMRRLVALALSALALSAVPPASAGPVATVVVAQGVDPTTLDPMNHQEAPATVLANNLFDGLLERDPDL